MFHRKIITTKEAPHTKILSNSCNTPRVLNMLFLSCDCYGSKHMTRKRFLCEKRPPRKNCPYKKETHLSQEEKWKTIRENKDLEKPVVFLLKKIFYL